MSDLKYLAAYSIPATALLALTLGGAWSFLTPVYAFVCIPLLEVLLPENQANIEGAKKHKAAVNPVFDWMLYLNVPIVYGVMAYGLLAITRAPVTWVEWVGCALSAGIVLGVNGINVGHELGHRKSRRERLLGKLLLLPSFYSHFYIEHNLGHHVHAATPEDPATAKYNQSLYGFWAQTLPGQYRNAWILQQKALEREGKPFLSLYNDMLWGHLGQAAYLLGLYLAFGPGGVLFALAAGLTGVLLLETVNYIEHYGLLRLKTASGRYERVREVHSWNSNHIMGRIVLYELTRHSDHHYKSSKKYQLLDYHDTSPEMPFGYPTSMVLALVPPLWFRIMNKRVPEPMRPNE
ncbi:alkane 1-monooxygenase [Robiginitalea sediminis]|uniref:alkane 1-monooxygenase n=1 Tax=Robiginitalea sediminis TaxID=1982593 RepID=UPI000B4ABCF9|nr:alkane 1-monooxygenase [Robiginitalea sediminis]